MKRIEDLLQFIGISKGELPDEIQQSLMSYEAYFGSFGGDSDKESMVLEDIMHWFNSRPQAKVRVIPEVVGKSFISVQTSEKIKNLDDSINSYFRDIDKNYSLIHDYFGSIRSLREERLRLLLKMDLDMTAQLNEILEDSFWEYAQPCNGGVMFITPPIDIRHTDPAAGINVKVPLGRFTVELRASGLTVKAALDPDHPNTNFQGFYHPHISTSGAVCCGTAHQIYTEGMNNLTFKRMFVALRAILENYNPDSPYKELYNWSIKLGLFDLSKYTIVYRKCDYVDSSEWIHSDDMPDDFDYEGNSTDYRDDLEDDDGEYYSGYRLSEPFLKYIREFGCYIEDSDYYYKTTNGGYALWPA